MAANAKERKSSKYAQLPSAYLFMLVAIETTGVFGLKISAFVTELEKRIYEQNGEEKASSFLVQRLSVAIQRGNAAAIRRTCNCMQSSCFDFIGI